MSSHYDYYRCPKCNKDIFKQNKELHNFQCNNGIVNFNHYFNDSRSHNSKGSSQRRRRVISNQPNEPHRRNERNEHSNSSHSINVIEGDDGASSEEVNDEMNFEAPPLISDPNNQENSNQNNYPCLGPMPQLNSQRNMNFHQPIINTIQFSNWNGTVTTIIEEIYPNGTRRKKQIITDANGRIIQQLETTNNMNRNFIYPNMVQIQSFDPQQLHQFQLGMNQFQQGMNRMNQQMRQQMSQMGQQMRQQMRQMGQQMRQQMSQMGQQMSPQMNRDMNQMNREMNRDMNQMNREMNRDMNQMNREMNRDMNQMNIQINRRMPQGGYQYSGPGVMMQNYSYDPFRNLLSNNSSGWNNMFIPMDNFHNPFNFNSVSGDFQNQGISDEDFENLPEITINEHMNISQDNKKCMICLETFQNGDKAKFLQCIHLFHTNCIKDWYKEHTFCPICKTEFNQEHDSIVVN